MEELGEVVSMNDVPRLKEILERDPQKVRQYIEEENNENTIFSNPLSQVVFLTTPSLSGGGGRGCCVNSPSLISLINYRLT